jgi:hypothetical protein
MWWGNFSSVPRTSLVKGAKRKKKFIRGGVWLDEICELTECEPTLDVSREKDLFLFLKMPGRVFGLFSSFFYDWIGFMGKEERCRGG